MLAVSARSVRTVMVSATRTRSALSVVVICQILVTYVTDGDEVR